MSYANGTTHYNLPLTVGTDKRDWTDTNQAFTDVDSALYTASTSASSSASAIVTLQNDIHGTGGIDERLTTAEGDITTIEGNITTIQGSITSLGNKIDAVEDDCLDMICAVDQGTAQVATVAVSEGEYFRYNNVLYIATTSIAIGDTIVPNTNCTATNVATELAELDTDKADANVLETVISRNTLSTQGDTVTVPNDAKLVVLEMHDNSGNIMDSMTIPVVMLATEIAMFLNAGGDTNFTLNAPITYASNTFTLGAPTSVGWTFADVVIAFIK